MATIRPFRALRYGPDAATALPQLISPPGAGRQYPLSGLDGLHPYNILRLVRGRFDPANAPGEPPYAATRQSLQDWKRRGILVRDPEPAYYVWEQSFDFGGHPIVRRGLAALVLLEPLGKRHIFPHERTLRGPKPDLLRQLRALQTTLSLTLGLLDDPDHRMRTLLADPPAPRLLAEVDDGQGVHNRVYGVGDPGFIDRATRLVHGQAIVIADGHHRYETALTYQRERRRVRSRRGPDPADYTMMLLVPTEDADRSVLPAHRALRGLPRGWRRRLDRELARHARLDEMEDPRQLAAFMKRGRNPRFGIVLRDRLLGVRPRASKRVQRLIDAEPAVWRPLEVTIARAVLMRHALGICPDRYATKEHSLYPTTVDEVVAAVRRRGYQVGVLIRPTRALQVTSVARAGYKMPAKSTHFFPKPAKGLIMNSLKEF